MCVRALCRFALYLNLVRIRRIMLDAVYLAYFELSFLEDGLKCTCVADPANFRYLKLWCPCGAI